MARPRVEKRRVNRRWWMLAAPAAMALLVMGGVLAAMRVEWRPQRAAYLAQVRAVTEADEPLTFDEFAARFPRPAGPNAADQYRSIIHSLRDLWDAEGSVPWRMGNEPYRHVLGEDGLPPGLADLIREHREQLLRQYAEGVGADRPRMEYGGPRGPAIASPLTIYPLPIDDGMVDAWITLNPWLPFAGRGRLPAPHEPLPPITRAAVELWLPVHEPFIEALIDAGAIRDAWYIHCLRNPEASSNYHFTATQVSRLLKIRLLMMIERGDADAIVEALEAKAAFIRSLGDDPYASTARLHMRKLTTLRHYMERALNRNVPWTDAHLRRLMEMLDDLPRDDLLYRVALLERVGNHEFALWYARDRHGARQGTGGMPGSTWREHAALLEVLTAQVEVAKLPPHERQGQTRRLRRMISRIANDPHVQPGIFTAEGMRNFPGLIDDDRSGRIMVAISRAALGVERYYLSHGRLPENLDVLVPDYLNAVPIDPCNGRPIRFNRVQGGYVTWSIWYRPYLRGPLTPEYDIATFSGFGSAFAVRRPLPPD